MAELTDKDLYAEALDRLLEQLKGKLNIASLLSVFSSQSRLIQEMFISMLTLTQILQSVGEQLDGLGAIVGETRMGRNDFDFQIALLARVRLNFSRGTTEDIYSVMRLIVGADPTMSLVDSYPAAFTLTVTGTPLADVTHAAAILKSARAAGVGSQLVYQTIDDAHRFTLAPLDGTLVAGDNDKGLADASQTTGGHFAGVV